MNKAIYILTAVIGFSLIFFSQPGVLAKKDGAPSSNTGSPTDEGTCAKVGCHTGSPVSREGIITTNIPAEGYTPGETYTITVSISSETRNTFGFQVSPQDASGNKVGTLELTDPDRTKLTGLSKYVTHNLNSLEGDGGNQEWTFDWNAGTASGDFTFYGAVNVANGNNTATGDSIYVTSLTVTQNTGTTDIELEDLIVRDLLVLQNPVADQLYLNQNLVSAGTLIQIFNLNGALVVEAIQGELDINVKDLLPGLYIISTFQQGERHTARFIKS